MKNLKANLTAFAVISLAAIAFTGCGGGGSGNSSSTESAQGFWIGQTSKGTVVNLVVLENGEVWGIYGSSLGVTGAVYGNAITNGAAFSGSGIGFNFVTRTSNNGNFTGTVKTKESINLSVSDGTVMSGTYDARYEQSASLANLAGTYTGQAVSANIAPQFTTVVVDVNGNIFSTNISGNLVCTTTGKATPRATGKNVFDVQTTSTGNNCALGNGTVVNGVGTYDAVKHQLIAMGLNASKTDGLMFLGTR